MKDEEKKTTTKNRGGLADRSEAHGLPMAYGQ